VRFLRSTARKQKKEEEKVRYDENVKLAINCCSWNLDVASALAL